MSNYFEVSINDDMDDAPRLVVSLVSGAFRGEALAYFDSAMLEAKSKTFSKMPLESNETLSISLGYLDKTDHSKVENEHIGIRASRIGTSGKVMIEVSLAQAEIEPGFQGARAMIRVRFLATYGQLGDFSSGMGALARREIDTVRFEEWTG